MMIVTIVIILAIIAIIVILLVAIIVIIVIIVCFSIGFGDQFDPNFRKNIPCHIHGVGPPEDTMVTSGFFRS